MTVSVAQPRLHKSSNEQASLIRAELAVILAHESFSTSRRCRDFLQFIVEHALAGDYEGLTERFLGVELFGRPVDYETATDSIVRVRANDVRRRLSQYYASERLASPVRIDLLAGGYVPEFHWVCDEKAAPPPALDEAAFTHLAAAAERPAPSPKVTPGLPVKTRWQPIRVLLWTGGVAALLAAAVTLLVLHIRQNNFDRFWRPVLEGSSAPILSLPTTNTLSLTYGSNDVQDQLSAGKTVNLRSDQLFIFHNWHESLPIIQATLSVALALERHGKTSLIRMGTDLSRDELRGHPIIAIGSFSSPWTKQNIAGLRFTFDRGASDLELPRIRDAFQPQRSWSLARIYPATQTRDFAIVTRTFDPVTREPFISLAGLHSFGNQIAAEFVSQDSSWNAIAARAPAAWEKMNLQVVLEADVVGTTPGSPRIVDVYFWK